MFFSLVQLVVGLSVMSAPCPAYMPERQVSCYDPAARTIYLKPASFAPRFSLAHEYGHAWDYDRLNDETRARFQVLLGFSPLERWRNPGGYSPSEAFANAYADCALGKPRRIRRVCALLPRYGRARVARLLS